LLSYDVAHSIPWDWRVSLYTWTKGIASGVYLVAVLLVLLGVLQVNDPIWLWVTPVISGAFLAITGGLLLWDLEHPERFYLIFTRPQWRSWLVKGAFIIAAYTLVLMLHFFASWAGSRTFQSWLMIAGIPLSILTAVYTAYLFAQAKARDMWQNPLLPPHLLVQALLLGAAVLLLTLAGLGNWLRPDTGLDYVIPPQRLETNHLIWLLGLTSLIHLLMVWGEASVTHVTAHARLALHEMIHGRFRNDFWIGTLLSFLGGLLPLLTLLDLVTPTVGAGGAPLALVGLMLFESAYVQSGQSVPLA
jgi:formate-dependent nitrite reductase membrane component NrfD